MANLNIYKIDNNKHEACLIKLNSVMESREPRIRQIEYREENHTFGFTLYLPRALNERELGWQWILDIFDEAAIEISTQPKGVVLVEHEEDWYAITFGNAYFLIDQFCDREFPFAFARKHEFVGIKTTALLSPNTRKNKVINTFIDYDNLEFDSGESFAKLKAKISFDSETTPIFNPAIEIGNSIRLSTTRESLDSIAEIILYIENTISSDGEVINKIPVFSRVKDSDKLAELNGELQQVVLHNPSSINISELDIIGVTEVFNNNDSEFMLRYGRNKKAIPQLSFEEIQIFCTECSLDIEKILLDIKVVSLRDGTEVRTDCIRNLIDYTNDTHKCLLSKGIWYEFNDDYLSYLHDSIAEIDVEYHSQYDFSKSEWKNYIDRMYLDEKDSEEYRGMSEKEIRTKIERKYYAERAFNNWRAAEGFENHDRTIPSVSGMPVELMDLYCNETIFAVKKGSSSEKLCYAVDQSLSSLKIYKHNLLDMPHFKTVVIWLILERVHPLPNQNGKPDINSLNMLSLKNKLDQWKKEVRLLGLRPLIYINYTID